ncbi:hypothetical protein BBP40_000043 [Aspergillus hancockii]|nr:hypothetical protein BBP40_000043 [Aspergillus hancockii]
MPGDEYSVGGGGKLKLKGSKVSDGRIEKKKKKAKKANPESTTATNDKGKSVSTPALEKSPVREQEGSDAGMNSSEVGPAKTEAERKYEEMKKKRLQERLKREGVKTHKERVEELNKYLSRLSEHHDMPKIGPG